MLENYTTPEAFETFTRPDNMRIFDYLNHFDKLFNERKSYGTNVGKYISTLAF